MAQILCVVQGFILLRDACAQNACGVTFCLAAGDPPTPFSSAARLVFLFFLLRALRVKLCVRMRPAAAV